MSLKDEKRLIDNIKATIRGEPDYKILAALQAEARYIFEDYPSERDYVFKITDYVKFWTLALSARSGEQRYQDLYWDTLLFEAPHLLDSFMLYMEKNRPPRKKFYLPRRKTLKVVVDDLRDLEDRKIKFLGVSMPPRVGKSTTCIFFMAWIMGKRPESHNLMGGHSGELAKLFYKEISNLIFSPEYTFHEIFPYVRLEDKSAQGMQLYLHKTDRFATLTCRGIEATLTGAVDVSADGYLYVDDLVRDRTESLSPTRLEGRYQDYLNVLADRKNDGSRELMVGTRWNVMDPLGRIERENKDNPKFRFRKIPALNENDESNFVYDCGLGFSTEYFIEDVKKRLDKNEWEAKYQQRPFVREGLLFPEDKLRYFNGILPEGGFVRVVTACDVAWGGGDRLSMPIGLEYENGDVYVVDWVFNKGTKDITIPIVAGKIMGNKIQQINFEANNGGEMYSKYMSDYLREQNYKCSITYTKAPNTMSKLAKIIQYSDDIKRRFIFLSPKCDENAKYKRSQEYDEAMDELCTFVQIGNNEHEDAADSLSQLERFMEGATVAKVEAVKNPFWM